MANTYLELEEYCDGCALLEPMATTRQFHSADEVLWCEVQIRCKNASKCKAMYERLKAKTQEENKFHEEATF